jgi:hypothetical protein
LGEKQFHELFVTFKTSNILKICANDLKKNTTDYLDEE